MTALVRGELIKGRTTRTALGFAAAAVLLVLATVVISALASDPTSLEDKRRVVNFGGTLSAVLLIFGVVGASSEYRHRTLAPALLIAPDRTRVDLARTSAYALAALLIGLPMLLVAFGLGIPLLGGTRGPDLAGSDFLRAAGGGLLASVLAAVLGVGVGILVRNQVAGVVGSLVWFFIVEPLLTALSPDLGHYSVGQAATAVGGTTGEMYLSFGSALAVLAAWAAVFVAVGVAVDRRRDVE